MTFGSSTTSVINPRSCAQFTDPGDHELLVNDFRKGYAVKKSERISTTECEVNLSDPQTGKYYASS